MRTPQVASFRLRPNWMMAKVTFSFRLQSVCKARYKFSLLRPDSPRMPVDSMLLHFSTLSSAEDAAGGDLQPAAQLDDGQSNLSIVR